MGGEENIDSSGKEFGNARNEGKKKKHTKNNHVCMNVISSLKSRQADDSG